jgi:hypothetical protein
MAILCGAAKKREEKGCGVGDPPCANKIFKKNSLRGTAPLKFPRLSKIHAEKSGTLLLFGLGRISNCWLPPSLAEELSFRSS